MTAPKTVRPKIAPAKGKAPKSKPSKAWSAPVQGVPPEKAVHGIIAPLLSLAIPMASITPDPANERTHSRQNLDAIRASLTKYGQREPIVVNRLTGMIESGHGRWIVMNELGWTHVAAVFVEDDAKTASGYRVVANRSAELADWDDEKLLATLRDLGDAALPDIGFTSADLKRIEKSLLPPDSSGEKTITPTFGAKIKCPKCKHEWTEKES